MRDGRRRHINVREVRAALSAEKVMGILHPNSYYLHLQDSQVSLACMVKGRSSSSELNRLLRGSIPFHAGSNVHGFYGYCRSKANPADDPTRDVSIRSPSRVEPSWLAEAKRGSFCGMDDFLHQQGNSLAHLAGLPPEEELWAEVEIDGSTSKSRRSLRGRVLGEFNRKVKKGKAAQHRVEVASADDGDAEVSSRAEDLEIGAEFNASAQSNSPESPLPSGPSVPGRTSDDRQAGSSFIRQADSDKEPRVGLPEDVVEKLLQFREDQFVLSKDFTNIREALAAGPGVLDLYSGARGFSRAFVDLNGGCGWTSFKRCPPSF